MSRSFRLWYAFIVLFAACVSATAAQSPSVEGTWTITQDRGDGPLMGRHPPSPDDLSDGVLAIRLTRSAATVDTATGDRRVSRSYPLDAADTARVRARLLNGVLTVRRSEVVKLPLGETTLETLERYSLQPDGSLLLERTATADGRSTTRRHVFERKR